MMISVGSTSSGSDSVVAVAVHASEELLKQRYKKSATAANTSTQALLLKRAHKELGRHLKLAALQLLKLAH